MILWAESDPHEYKSNINVGFRPQNHGQVPTYGSRIPPSESWSGSDPRKSDSAHRIMARFRPQNHGQVSYGNVEFSQKALPISDRIQCQNLARRRLSGGLDLH